MVRRVLKQSRADDVPVSAPARNFAARNIAALIAPVIRPIYRARAPAAAQLLADWEALAGPELCARAVPVKFAGGTLVLACTATTAMELQYAATGLISRLNGGLGQQMIERLRFVQQAPVYAPPALPRTPPKPVEPPQNLPEGPLGEALGRLYQGIARRG